MIFILKEIMNDDYDDNKWNLFLYISNIIKIKIAK